MSSYTYLESPNVNLLCCICRSPFVEPCTTRTCCHTFCYDCITQAIHVNRQCPIDRTALSLHDLIPADPLIRNLVDELMVRCPQESNGCSYTCQRLLLPVHLKDSCQYVELSCPAARCSQRILRKDINEHRCEGERDQVSDNELSRSAPDDSSQQEYMQSPPSVPASSDTVESAAQPTVDLAAENSMLRFRLSALESVVHTLRSEMFAVKHALGPWYRPDVQPQLLPEEQSDDYETSSEAFERQLAEELATQPAAIGPDMHSSTTARDPADIASYFPPAEEEVVQTSFQRTRHSGASGINRIYSSSSGVGQVTHGSISPPGIGTSYPPMFPSASPSFPTPGQTPGVPYAQGASFTSAAPAAISIPPLDPYTPLPDTLATLHSSLVTLAGALGALAATRGAESLRTTEELRGLRGAMHGLRMQVHDILTSRTYLGGNATPGSSGDNDSREHLTYLGMSGGFGYGPRQHGMPPVYHPHHPSSPFGGPPMPPPTNITKL